MRGTRGFLAAGGDYDGSKAGGRYLAKVGCIEVAPGDRYKASLVIHREEASNGSRVGSLATNIRVLCKRDKVRGHGGGTIAVVALDSRGMASEDHAKTYFDSSKGAAATGILQTW